MNHFGEIIFYLFLLAPVIFFFGFSIISIRERRIRAAILSFVSADVLFLIGLLIYQLNYYTDWLLIFPFIIFIATLLFFVPFSKSRDIQISPSDEKFDERDTMFARADYKAGAEEYEDYYTRRLELKNIDDKLRKLPGLLSPASRYYDKKKADQINSTFEKISSMTTSVDGECNPNQSVEMPKIFSNKIKNLTLELGADGVGIAELNQRYVYSHVGRGPEPYGQPIENNHKYVIVFIVEMNYEMVEKAPQIEITEETARGYLKAAKLSIALAQHIREMGYPARAHISDSNYQIILPPVAYDAGLGELGRHGYLISPKYGSRVRLGAVTTDLPLVIDKPINFGVQEFCDICKRCAVNCPSAAIPNGATENVRNVKKWQLGVEACFKYWCSIGTDCGLCVKVCPFSHPPTFIHNLVRTGIKNSAFARRLSVYGEDIFYGKKVEL